MFFSAISKLFTREQQNNQRGQQLQDEAANFKLATDGGFPSVVKYGLFLLFGYYNARLFITTVPGWEGWLTAAFALASEGLALYCIHNFTRSAGLHKAMLALFGLLLTLFSVTHATISFFALENHAQLSEGIQFYAQRVAFPLLFGLLLVAVLTLRFTHWNARIAAEQALAQVKIASSRARLVAESAAMRDEAQLGRERLAQMDEQIRLDGECVGKLKQRLQIKEQERQLIASISDPALREQMALELGITLPPGNGAGSKPMVTWNGGKIVSDERPNGERR